MFIIRKNEMDNIATKVFEEHAPRALEYPEPINIESLAEDCPYLSIKYKYISFDNKILGLTAFGDVRISYLGGLFMPTEIDISEGTIVINSALLGRAQRTHKLYTIAHEISPHLQIIDPHTFETAQNIFLQRSWSMKPRLSRLFVVRAS